MAIAGILLAAGSATRMGRNKLLLDLDGEPLVRRAARRALEAGLSPLLVVVGHEADRVREALSGLPCRFVPNPGWAAGQGTSLAAGAAAVPGEAEAAVVVLADMPLVTADMIRAVAARHRETGRAGGGEPLRGGHRAPHALPPVRPARVSRCVRGGAGARGDPAPRRPGAPRGLAGRRARRRGRPGRPRPAARVRGSGRRGERRGGPGPGRGLDRRRPRRGHRHGHVHLGFLPAPGRKPARGERPGGAGRLGLGRLRRVRGGRRGDGGHRRREAPAAPLRRHRRAGLGGRASLRGNGGHWR